MTGATEQRQLGAEATGSILASLGGMLRDFNRTAETVLNELRENPRQLASHEDLMCLHGTEQLRELRAAMPRRTMAVTEGLHIAERQAALLRWQLNAETVPALSSQRLAELPFLTVTYRARLAKSGLATKTEHGWVIVLKADEPSVRQRFSLGHEIKHTLDDELLAEHPGGLYQTWGGRRDASLAERVCDHFSACLLMPKLLVRRDWTAGTQDTARLARCYQVSTAAMTVRLRQLGLSEPHARCGT